MDGCSVLPAGTDALFRKGKPAFAASDPSECPVASHACDEVLSLPLHPGLNDTDVELVAASVNGEAAMLTLKD